MSKMQFLQELNVNENYDVIVAGGGPAGCSAAAAAAREGAKTLLIEATSSLGGMGTSGLIPAWCPFTDKERIIYGGIAEKVLKKCIAGMPHVPEDNYVWTPIDPELLKRIYDDLITENGGEILFNTQLAAVNMDGDKVDSIIVANKAGLSAYKAKVFIDCTGDADMATWAGAEYEKGNEEGTLQQATMCFSLANVDYYAYTTEPALHPNNKESKIFEIMEDDKYPLIHDAHCCQNTTGPGVVGFNAGHIPDVDNTNPESVSKALIQGRKIAHEFQMALAEYCPKSFGNAFLVQTSSLMGIRETRRIIGDYYLTAEELKNFASFEDEIGRNCYYIDIHLTKKEKESGKPKVHGFRFPKGKSHGIPYRCLVPKGIENMLMAGRCISTDRNSQGSTRVMPVCLMMGEAAGVAAGMTANAGKTAVRDIDISELRGKLSSFGGYLPPVEK